MNPLPSIFRHKMTSSKLQNTEVILQHFILLNHMISFITNISNNKLTISHKNKLVSHALGT